MNIVGTAQAMTLVQKPKILTKPTEIIKKKKGQPETVGSWLKRNFINYTYDYQDYVFGALTLMAAISWQSAFQELFDSIGWLHAGGPWLYAILLTLLIVFTTNTVREYQYKWGMEALHDQYQSKEPWNQ